MTTTTDLPKEEDTKDLGMASDDMESDTEEYPLPLEEDPKKFQDMLSSPLSMSEPGEELPPIPPAGWKALRDQKGWTLSFLECPPMDDRVKVGRKLRKRRRKVREHPYTHAIETSVIQQYHPGKYSVPQEEVRCAEDTDMMGSSGSLPLASVSMHDFHITFPMEQPEEAEEVHPMEGDDDGLDAIVPGWSAVNFESECPCFRRTEEPRTVKDFVFKMLPIRDLKKCRLVSRSWNLTASQILRESRKLVARLRAADLLKTTYPDDVSTYWEEPEKGQFYNVLKMAKEILPNWPTIIQEFHLTLSAKDSEERAIQVLFWKKYALTATKLIINNRVDDLSKRNACRKLVRRCARTLVRFGCVYPEMFEASFFSDGLAFPELQALSLFFPSALKKNGERRTYDLERRLNLLLKAAPKLSVFKVRSSDLPHCPPLIPKDERKVPYVINFFEGAFQNLQSLSLSCHQYLLESFASYKGKINCRSLTLLRPCYVGDKITRLWLTFVLSLVGDTLTTLDMSFFNPGAGIGFFDDFPFLPALRTIHVSSFRPGDDWITQKTPELHHLYMDELDLSDFVEEVPARRTKISKIGFQTVLGFKNEDQTGKSSPFGKLARMFGSTVRSWTITTVWVNSFLHYVISKENKESASPLRVEELECLQCGEFPLFPLPELRHLKLLNGNAEITNSAIFNRVDLNHLRRLDLDALDMEGFPDLESVSFFWSHDLLVDEVVEKFGHLKSILVRNCCRREYYEATDEFFRVCPTASCHCHAEDDPATTSREGLADFPIITNQYMVVGPKEIRYVEREIDADAVYLCGKEKRGAHSSIPTFTNIFSMTMDTGEECDGEDVHSPSEEEEEEEQEEQVSNGPDEGQVQEEEAVEGQKEDEEDNLSEAPPNIA